MIDIYFSETEKKYTELNIKAWLENIFCKYLHSIVMVNFFLNSDIVTSPKFWCI